MIRPGAVAGDGNALVEVDERRGEVSGIAVPIGADAVPEEVGAGAVDENPGPERVIGRDGCRVVGRGGMPASPVYG